MPFRTCFLGWTVLLIGPAVAAQDCGPDALARNLSEAHAAMRSGEFARSEQTFQVVLACQRQILPPDHLDIAVTLGNLGELKRLQRQFKAAGSLLLSSIALHESAGRTGHSALGTALLSLASVYKDRRQYHLAEPLARRSIEILGTSPGPESREAVAAINTLAVLYAESGNLEGAERLFRSAIARRQALGPDVSTATAEHNLGSILSRMDRPREAEEWLRNALTLRAQLLGIHHPGTLLTLEAYEKFLKQHGRKAEARQLRTRLETGLLAR